MSIFSLLQVFSINTWIRKSFQMTQKLSQNTFLLIKYVPHVIFYEKKLRKQPASTLGTHPSNLKECTANILHILFFDELHAVKRVPPTLLGSYFCRDHFGIHEDELLFHSRIGDGRIGNRRGSEYTSSGFELCPISCQILFPISVSKVINHLFVFSYCPQSFPPPPNWVI